MKKRALLVGVDAYEGSPLIGCVDDALRLGEILKKNHDGSPNFSCQYLLGAAGGSHKVTKSSLNHKIHELLAFEADMALFYFSGHGFLHDSKGYLVTQDGTQDDEGIPFQDLLEKANNSPVKEVIIILDTCHSGNIGQSGLHKEKTATLREGVAILTASRETQYAIATSNGSVFTTLVCDAIKGGASDVIGEVNVASVYAFTDQVLGPWNQRPLFKAHVSQLLPIRMSEPSVPPEVLRKLPELFADPHATFQLDPSYEPDRTVRPGKWKKVDSPENERKLWYLQKLRDGRLLVPVGEAHLFYAAINSKECQLTSLGKFYWQRAKNELI